MVPTVSASLDDWTISPGELTAGRVKGGREIKGFWFLWSQDEVQSAIATNDRVSIEVFMSFHLVLYNYDRQIEKLHLISLLVNIHLFYAFQLKEKTEECSKHKFCNNICDFS